MVSYRKFVVIFLSGIAAGLLILFGQQKTPQSVSRTDVDARPLATGNSTNGSSSNGSLAAVLPGRRSDTAVPRNGSGQVSFGANSLGLYNESVRSLMRSQSSAKVDYGLFQVLNVCRSFLHGVDGLTAVRGSPSLPQMHKVEELVIGNATEAVRLTGFQRSLDKCTKLYEGAKLTQNEQDAARALPAVVQYRGILNTLSNAKNFDDPETFAALSDAVSGPMFGALSPLLAFKLDYADLTNAYSVEQIDALRTLTIPLVLCRLGDDCGPGGTVTEQLCWEYGVCSDRVEDAIFANLRARGLDTTAFNRFILRVHQALLTGDTSIFRKQKPTK